MYAPTYAASAAAAARRRLRAVVSR